MIDIFQKRPLDLSHLVCHSGGAIGSDSYFETLGQSYGVGTKAYSWRTPGHTSPNKVEISDSDYKEGVVEIHKANKILRRWGIEKYMNLLARNWAQVKYSSEVFAIGSIIEAGKKGPKGYYNKSEFQVVEGGTGYACMVAVNNARPLWVFDQERDSWYRWSYTALKFIKVKEQPVISFQNFAGIGTREIKPNGIGAIADLYSRTFSS